MCLYYVFFAKISLFTETSKKYLNIFSYLHTNIPNIWRYLQILFHIYQTLSAYGLSLLIHIRILTHIRIYTHLHIYVFSYSYITISVYLGIKILKYTNMKVSAFVETCICKCVNTNIFRYVNIWILVHVCETGHLN